VKTSTTLAILIMVAVMFVGAACTGSTEDSAPSAESETRDAEPVEVSAPPGFRIHRGEEYGFAFPSDWTPVPGGGTFVAGADIEIVGPTGDVGLPALITLYREEGFKGDFERYLFAFNGEASTALPDRNLIRSEPASVPQSVQARVIESEYTLPGLVAPEPDTDTNNRKKSKEKDGDAEKVNEPEGSDESEEPPGAAGSVTIRQVDILVLTRDNITINLRAAAPAEEFDDFSEIFTTVVNSLRVRPPSIGDA
jgi:hypothetical protein